MKLSRSQDRCELTLVLALLALLVLPIDVSAQQTSTAKKRSCGSLQVRYREDNGAVSFIQVSNIRANNVRCGRARSVARTWARKSRLSGDPAYVARGYDCAYIRAGSDVGRTVCSKGSHSVRFGAYDSSPYH